MYIPIVLPAGYATPFDVAGSTSTTHDSISGESILVARRVGALRGRAGYAMGSGIAIAFIGAFVLGVLARCMIRERRARRQAKAHVQALAVQDRDLWGVDTTSGRRVGRQRDEDEDDGVQEEETEAERRIRRRQERREKEHGKFDSVLERLERRALQEEGLKESSKGQKSEDGGTKGSIAEKRSSGEGPKDSGSESEDSRAEKVAKPEPVYKGTGTRLFGGHMSLSSLRTSIS